MSRKAACRATSVNAGVILHQLVGAKFHQTPRAGAFMRWGVTFGGRCLAEYRTWSAAPALGVGEPVALASRIWRVVGWPPKRISRCIGYSASNSVAIVRSWLSRFPYPLPCFQSCRQSAWNWIPGETRARMASHLESIDLTVADVLYEPGSEITSHMDSWSGRPAPSTYTRIIWIDRS
jgi:hypothetical protein